MQSFPQILYLPNYQGSVGLKDGTPVHRSQARFFHTLSTNNQKIIRQWIRPLPKNQKEVIMKKSIFLLIILLEVSFAKLPANIDQSVEIVLQAFSGNNQERCISPHLRNVSLFGNQLK